MRPEGWWFPSFSAAIEALLMLKSCKSGLELQVFFTIQAEEQAHVLVFFCAFSEDLLLRLQWRTFERMMVVKLKLLN